MQSETDSYIVDQFNDWYLQISQIYSKINHLTVSYGLTYDQYLILRMVKLSPDIEVTKIAENFSFSGPAVSRKINVLFRKHLIIKDRSDELDQRKVFISLSENGQRVVDQLEVDFYLFFKQFKDESQANLDQLFEQTGQLFQTMAKWEPNFKETQADVE